LEDFMKKQIQPLCFLSALVLFLSMGMALSAQQPSQGQSADSQTQQTPEQAQPNQTPAQKPDQAGQATPESQAQPAGTQSFTGTIVKSGDKYVFQDAASGNTYDIDHQDEVQKYEGKKVKVHGTLDESAKMIRLQ
jgi:uncharacterized protein YdeI (BOF family)